ncbi:succinate dehydrogenase [ubiquinone] cytochrome b small subunit B, mitochondrial-like [Patiria miniata]|uniref:Succinate dehydrogenase [ubiquinone] cytochrome b small subunit n=1 Tax=Patiria miniata TaxID=46514 RepID=A0A914AFF5_PATMI|nr:succinate dehydrogenase [ubiquinone] cytochrome b small subunit B, mitochondrial-like [Patiria miniata]XP_038062697.1 succinate dehydrogenase [ubiquinone] cytochrome b small subunit B, mitochondrial-like [Patiria miniata]
MAALRILRTRALLVSPQLVTRSFLKTDNARTPYAPTAVHTTPQNQNAGQSGMMASTRWKFEHMVTLAMTAAVPTAFITQHPLLDYVLAGCLTLHGHWGMESIFLDYMPGKTLPKVANSCLFGVSVLTFAGLCYFNYNDVGITKAIMMLWS